MSRILVVDDELPLRRALAANLQARGYDVELAPTGEDALRLATSRLPDLVILDLGLPGIDGIEVIRGLRGWTTVPILVLSARGTESDKVAALDAGADDYVAKPFGMDELLARVRAALRRTAPTDDIPVLVTDDFRIDFTNKQVLAPDETPIRLTPTEWHLLEVLARNTGKLVTTRQLLHEVWGPAYEDQGNYIRVHIAHLRRKIEPTPAQPRYITTEPGFGYRFTAT